MEDRKAAIQLSELLKAELNRSRELEAENARLAEQNLEMLRVLQDAATAPEDSGELNALRVECDWLRAENTNLRCLLDSTPVPFRLAEISSPFSEGSEALVMLTPPVSPRTKVRLALPTGVKTVVMSSSPGSSSPSPPTPEEEMTDFGRVLSPRAFVSPETSPRASKEPEESSSQLDFRL
jgi:hypothetical protein